MFLGDEYVVHFVNREMNLLSMFSLNCHDFHRPRVTLVITESPDTVFNDLCQTEFTQEHNDYSFPYTTVIGELFVGQNVTCSVAMNKLFIDFKNKPGGTVSELIMFL